MKEGINQIYSNRNNFLVLGLTGRTGSGCSTTAEKLSSKENDFKFPPVDSFDFLNENEKRKYKITLNFAKNNWNQFYTIRVKDIITTFILENSFSNFCAYLNKIIPETDFFKKLSSLEEEYESLYTKRIELIKNENHIEIFYFHFTTLNSFTEKLKFELSKSHNSYTSIYQTIGNNIRSCGKALSNDCEINCKNTDALVKKINKFIKLIGSVSKTQNRKCFIVIDALRNPFEVSYLKERYSAFYLLAINVNDSDRKERLQNNNYTKEQIEKLDNQEYPKKLKGIQLYISQNIQQCTELADIHIHNSNTENENFCNLKKQLIHYYSLMLKPGIVPPTSIERVMQLAHTAKLNSGCLSRQVGAAITDNQFSIKSIGWNNSPQGQVPCILRNSQDLINSSDTEAYSAYEKNNSEFRKYFKSVYENEEIKNMNKCGHNSSFCFKEVQNNLENEKNQVHTRSLHAEENAFLQLTKYGSQGIENGILFTTASPCELCSKKAYQLGIKRIYFIDPYPGIATTHILKGGNNNPKLILFNGVIGKSYFQLYQPLLPYKDEIKERVELTFPNVKENELEKANSEITMLKKRILELEKK
ncbi:dCMP deaminase [Arenibacter nanhaiticus]|uniref:dCMP deaminase n=1 Tax=Arenibacter nanhaiticus TaxID=558155 RepID=A0A1M6MYE7_9FLAO|nr:hypothetical protein [Arenibacter nanhaiticus]SHJ88400.1 dCMP deaminase [Arenibacter nanhaiticus]